MRRGQVGLHSQQEIAERFNRTLAERLFGAQCAQKLLLAKHGSSERSSEWVRALHDVVSALNNETTRLTGKKPVDAIKISSVAQNSSLSGGRTTDLKPLLPSNSSVVPIRELTWPG